MRALEVCGVRARVRQLFTCHTFYSSTWLLLGWEMFICYSVIEEVLKCADLEAKICSNKRKRVKMHQ